MNRTLRLGTRGSELALAQSGHMARALEQAWPGLRVELVVIRTRGDRDANRTLASFGGKGVFTREIEDALLAGEVDFAVHSLKDLPSQLPPGLVLAGPPPREDPRDVLIARVPLEDLPEGARVATGSPRRRAQLLAHRPDLACLEIRGNLPTRVRKWREGTCEATVLAMAGLKRLGFAEAGLGPSESHPLAPELCLPAPAQGLLGLEFREADESTRELLAALADPAAGAAAAAERAFLTELEGGCNAPAGALAEVRGGRLGMRAILARPDGTQVLRREVEGALDEAAAIGRRLARELLEAGGSRILEDARATLESPPPSPP